MEITQATSPHFRIEDVSIAYRTKRGLLQAVSNAFVTIADGESVALIGESGCGKTTLATSIVGALPNAAVITHGKLLYKMQDGGVVDLLQLPKKQMRLLLWQDIAMVFQASQSSFNPVKRVKTQFIDAVRAHDRSQSTKAILQHSRELLEIVMLDADKVLNAFPHELSGGMKQRALIALSLILNPRLIILDEPTTALDLITQAKILELLNRLKKQFGFSLLFITHDLGIVSELSDRVVTMYAGRVVENSPTRDFFETPRHPYSKGLIDAIPRLSMDSSNIYSIPGSPPDMIDIKTGCPFAPRCPHRLDKCDLQMPPLTSLEAENRTYACWNPVTEWERND
ncbi:MAG: ABC transporter ATP-binding protein [Syntrophothermus sp.]